MSGSSLVTHCGANSVSLDELNALPCPEPVGRWRPIPHAEVFTLAAEQLRSAGYLIRQARHAVTRGGARYFATLDTESELRPGVGLAVGLRSSVDKSLCLGFCAGSRVFVCDNLAFSSEIVVAKKHTINCPGAFVGAVIEAVQKLGQFRTEEAARIERMQSTPLTDLAARGLILTAWEKDIISERQVGPTLSAWSVLAEENPHGPSCWRLYNAFTGALASLAQSNPQRFSRQTMALGRLLTSIPSVN